VYDVHVDDRLKGALNGQQHTGFAVTRGLTVVRQPDFTALDVRGDGRLRYGTRIDLTHQGQTIQLLSVHLKSGCFENASTSSACETLLAQVPVLEGWIDAAAQEPTPLIVLGDFNRRFTQPGDWVWADLDKVSIKTIGKEQPMGEQENTRLAQQAYENFKTGNIQALLSMCSGDIEWQLPEIEHVPFVGKCQSREQVGQFFASLGEEQEVLEFEPKELIAQGDKVVALGHYAWRVKSTRRRFEGDWAHVFTVREGQIVRFQEYTDTAAAAAAYRKP
jgi:ketosteroid isomerase-like protein